MLTGPKGEAVEGRRLTFEAANHDDILGIVERMRSHLPFDENTTASLGSGFEAVLRGGACASGGSDVCEYPARAE